MRPEPGLWISRVWVDRTGLAQLLDFSLEPGAPAPGRHAEAWAPEDTAHARSAPGGSPFRVSPPLDANWQEFLRQVATLGLTDRSADPRGMAPGLASPPRVPLPVHARAQLARLWGEGGGYAAVTDFVQALEQAQWRPAVIPRARRVATLLVPAVWPTLIFLATMLQSGSQYPAWFQDLIRDREYYVKALRRPSPAAGDSAALAATRAIELVLASGVTTAAATPRLGQQMLSFLPAADRALLDSLARRHPGVTLAQADTARVWLRAHRAAWMDARDIAKVGMVGQVSVGVIQVGVFGIAAVVLALILRGPPLLYLAGISVSNDDGTPAGRVRCALRSGVAWGPFIALLFLHRGPIALQIALALTGVAGVAYAMLNPERGVADRVMKTVLVPK